MSEETRARRRTGVVLALVLASAAVIQSLSLPVPITIPREAQSAAMARHIRDEGLVRVLNPRAYFSADGPGTVLMECPLVGAAGALIEALIPPLGEAAYRLPSMMLSMVAVVSLFALVRRRLGDLAALVAAALLALAPLHLEMSASTRPDEGALALSLLAIALVDKGRVISSSVVLSCAILTKATFLVMAIPWLSLVVMQGGLRSLVRWTTLASLAIVTIPIAAWQVHSRDVNTTSLLMGTLTVQEAVVDHAWQKGRVALMVAPEWYSGVLSRLAEAASIAGVALVFVGIVVVARRAPRGVGSLAVALACGTIALILVFPWHVYSHDYYCLAALPLLAFLGAAALGKAWELRGRHRLFGPAVAGVVVAVALGAAAIPGLPRTFERMRAHDRNTVEFGDVVRRLVPEGERVIVADTFIGPWDCSLLYRAERYGWRYSTAAFDENDPEQLSRLEAARESRGKGGSIRRTVPYSVSSELRRRTVPFSLSREHRLDAVEIDRLRSLGAKYFAYAGSIERLRRERPDIAQHVESRGRLLESSRSVTLFEIS